MKVFTKGKHKFCPYLLEAKSKNSVEIGSNYCINCHHRVNYEVDKYIRCDYEDIHTDKLLKTRDIEMFISGIWENEYVRTLGILDHCQEVIKLYDEMRLQKAYKALDVEDNLLKEVTDTFNRELMDLYLILDKHFENNNELKEIRLNRFKEKEIGK
jgi:hypothetical protein